MLTVSNLFAVNNIISKHKIKYGVPYTRLPVTTSAQHDKKKYLNGQNIPESSDK